jgi:hypothetical protein
MVNALREAAVYEAQATDTPPDKRIELQNNARQQRVLAENKSKELEKLGPDFALVPHYHLYALAKETAWRVEEAKAPDEPPGPNKNDPTAKLLKALDDADAFIRAAAIDLLGERRAKEAIPKLIDLVADGTALVGSDNYVGSHAAAALSKITGRPFSTDQKEWKAWLAKQTNEDPKPGATGGVKVLSAEATVELNGLLADTPKGVFLMVQEERLVPGLHGTENKLGAVAWELDFSKSLELAKQAKELSGKAAVVVGTCKMVQVPGTVGRRTGELGGIGSDDLLGIAKAEPGNQWEMQRIVIVTKLSAGEKK